MDVRGVSSSSHSGSSSGAPKFGSADFSEILEATEKTVNDGLSSYKAESSDLGLSALRKLEESLFSKLSPKGQASRSYGDRGSIA